VLGLFYRTCESLGKRSKPGLKSQHLTGIRLVGELTGARLKGAELNSSEISFVPSKAADGGTFSADIGTAGATTLLAQVIERSSYFSLCNYVVL